MRWADFHRKEEGLSPAAYDVVLWLRRAGHRVFCAKRTAAGAETHHELDGQIVPTSWLFDIAAAEARPAGGRA